MSGFNDLDQELYTALDLIQTIPLKREGKCEAIQKTMGYGDMD